MKKIVFVLAAALSLAACTNPDSTFNKQNVGAVLGGVGGAVVGAQFGGGYGKLATTALGALGGAFVGSEVGKSLDNADRNAKPAQR